MLKRTFSSCPFLIITSAIVEQTTVSISFRSVVSVLISESVDFDVDGREVFSMEQQLKLETVRF